MVFNSWRRPKNRQQPDRFLNRAHVAKFIGRDPARVTRYYKDGLLPDPDALLEGDTPLWHRSTIRSWWLAGGNQLSGDQDRLPPLSPLPRRYHQQWTDAGLEPALLEEQVLEMPHTGSRRATAKVHARVYRAMDGGSPVVLLGALQPHRWRNDWDEVITRVRSALDADFDFNEPIWLEVEIDNWRIHEHPSEGQIPSDVTIADLTDRGADITPSDVARLIGRPFDVYVPRLYTERAVADRRLSSDQDTPTSTPVLDDAEGLGKRLRRLHTLVDHIEGDDRTGPVAFAAGLIAAEIISTDDTIQKDTEYRRRRIYHSRENDDTTGSPVALAVFSQLRQLNPHENKLAAEYVLNPPLVTSEEHLDITEVTLSGQLYRYTLRADARPALEDIRRLLMDPGLADSSPLRDALTTAERILTETAHRADPVFASQDRTPVANTWGADSKVMAAYLSQLRPVTVDDLPYELKRRAAALQGYEYARDWESRTLLFDERHQLLALTGSEPSHLNERAARELAQAHRDPRRQLLDLAVEQALVDAYMANRPRVHLEWPQATETNGRALLADAHLVAPAATDIERPVFIRHADGQLQPLSLNGDTHFHGFVWGVSGTDTITPAVHALMTSTPTRSRLNDAGVDPGHDAYVWLANYILPSGRDPLDVAGAAIIDHYGHLPAL